MDHRILVLLILCLLIPWQGFSQSDEDSYSLEFAPDAWYNDVDGIRLGVRVLGEMEGTFKDGPHRLDAGVWLGTWIPDLPVSYYVSFTEPIPAISSYGSEGNIQLESSVRTGFSEHGLYFNKRWQFGFDEYEYLEFRTGFRTEKMFDEEYRQFPLEWMLDDELKNSSDRLLNESSWLQLLSADLLFRERNQIGPYSAQILFTQQVNGEEPFSRLDVIAQHKITFGSGFELGLRGFFGIMNKEAPYQYAYIMSMNSMINWIDRGISRAKGTIPSSILKDGIIQYSGGPNLRGYVDQDIQNFGTLDLTVQNSDHYLLRSIIAGNAELDIPNPLHKKLKSIPFLGDFIAMRSYLFYDVGTYSSSRYTSVENYSSNEEYDQVRSDAGVGFEFSINIPDYLGKDRGFFIRYDIPLWLSHPQLNDNNFKFRNLIGIGAVISL